MEFVLLFLVSLILPSFIQPMCCPKTKLSFVLKDIESTSCQEFGAETPGATPAEKQANNLVGKCETDVCGNGKVPEGFYCGRGPCNIIGCNCDDDCIPGNPKTSFKRIHGYGIINLVENFSK